MQTAKLVESAGEIDGNDPLGLNAGDIVEVHPVDTGFTHRDRGELRSLTPSEVVIAKRTKVGDREIQMHFPRWGFRILKVDAAGAKL